MLHEAGNGKKLGQNPGASALKSVLRHEAQNALEASKTLSIAVVQVALLSVGFSAPLYFAPISAYIGSKYYALKSAVRKQSSNS